MMLTYNALVSANIKYVCTCTDYKKQNYDRILFNWLTTTYIESVLYTVVYRIIFGEVKFKVGFIHICTGITLFLF